MRVPFVSPEFVYLLLFLGWLVGWLGWVFCHGRHCSLFSANTTGKLAEVENVILCLLPPYVAVSLRGASRELQLSQKGIVHPQGSITCNHSSFWDLVPQLQAEGVPWSPSSLFALENGAIALPWGDRLCITGCFCPCSHPLWSYSSLFSKVKLNLVEYCGRPLHKRLLKSSYWQITFLFCDCSSVFLPPAKQKKKKSNPTTLLDVGKYPFTNTGYCTVLSSWELTLMLILKNHISWNHIT